MGLAVLLGGGEATCPAGQLKSATAIGPHENRLEHIDSGDIGRQRIDVAHRDSREHRPISVQAISIDQRTPLYGCCW